MNLKEKKSSNRPLVHLGSKFKACVKRNGLLKTNSINVRLRTKALGAPKVISHPCMGWLFTSSPPDAAFSRDSHSWCWGRQDLSCLGSIPPPVRHSVLLGGCQKIVSCWQPVALHPPTVVVLRCLFLILMHIEAILDLEPKSHGFFLS